MFLNCRGFPIVIREIGQLEIVRADATDPVEDEVTKNQVEEANTLSPEMSIVSDSF